MKKILALVLAVMLVVSMAVTGFAAEVNDGSKDVTASYVKGASSDTIYSVDVTWGSMSFTYTSPAQGTWNPESHAYDGAETTGRWSYEADANKITVTNHSNAEVSVGLAYAANTGYEAVTGSFDKETLTLATAVDTEVDAAPSASAYLTLSGELAESEEAAVVGQITVTLNK